MIAITLTLLGAVAVARLTRVPDGTVEGLDWVVLNLSLPAVTVTALVDLPISAAAVVPVSVAWATLALSVGIVVAFARARGWSDAVVGALLLVVPLGNTSYLGYPAVVALLGREYLADAVLYGQLGTFLALSTYGAFVVARMGAPGPSHSDGPSASSGTVRRILLFPPFLALLVGIGVRSVGLWAPIRDSLELLGATLTPLAMIAVGIRLAALPLRRPAAPTVAALAIRMAILPAAVVGVVVAVGLSGPAWETSVLETAMPPMITAGILASSAGFDDRVASESVGLGILVSLVTLPGWAWLIHAVT